jgi:simple sugar transport system ATP-binding protein
VLSNLRPAYEGDIQLDGKEILGKSARYAQICGVAFVPEDRLVTGLVGNMNALDNLILRDYYRRKGAFIPYKEIRERAKKTIEEYDISMASPVAPVRLMSGGNLQKLLLAREITLNPKVMILSYPVRGLDIGATEKIYELMLKQRDKGCAIIFISEDLDALMRFSDRIMVLYRGRITGQVTRENARLSDIGMMMMGTSLEKEAQNEAYYHF